MYNVFFLRHFYMPINFNDEKFIFYTLLNVFNALHRLKLSFIRILRKKPLDILVFIYLEASKGALLFCWAMSLPAFLSNRRQLSRCLQVVFSKHLFHPAYGC